MAEKTVKLELELPQAVYEQFKEYADNHSTTHLTILERFACDLTAINSSGSDERMYAGQYFSRVYWPCYLTYEEVRQKEQDIAVIKELRESPFATGKFFHSNEEYRYVKEIEITKPNWIYEQEVDQASDACTCPDLSACACIDKVSSVYAFVSYNPELQCYAFVVHDPKFRNFQEYLPDFKVTKVEEMKDLSSYDLNDYFIEFHVYVEW